MMSLYAWCLLYFDFNFWLNEKNVGLESYQQLFLAQKIGKDLPVVNKLILPWEFIGNECLLSLADLEGGYGGCNPPPPFKFQK